MKKNVDKLQILLSFHLETGILEYEYWMRKLEGHIVFQNVLFWNILFYFSSVYVAKHFSLVYITKKEQGAI